ncbi:hypothetical protein [Azospirillum halopraeferens]|uniref:hypothetical protein n=1 Tax=Azospirillum halopraeferens TaxID=34010 RepID=UPI000413A3D3|nr:hypothetical protein [Azospirillum halopraeferens]
MVRALILCALLAGCAGAGPVEVKVPVPVRVQPPAELLVPIADPDAVFVPPNTEGVVACVAPAGRDALVGYVDLLRQRVQAWEAWAA